MTLPVNLYRTLDVKVEIAWNGSTYVDETNRLVSLQGALELVPTHEILQGGKQVIQRCSVTLQNTDFRFSPYNLDGPLIAYLATPGYFRKPLRVLVSENGVWTTIFTGFARLPTESYAQATATFEAVDLGETLRKNFSTGLLADYYEHDLIIYYLNLAGMTDGVQYISPTYAAANGVTATISRSNCKIPFSWLEDEPIWDEIVDIGQASGGRVYIDQLGRVNFEKGWSWFLSTTATETININTVGELNPVYREYDYYNEVVVEYAPRYLGPLSVVYSEDTVFWVYPGETEDWELRFQWPVSAFQAFTKGTTYKFMLANGQDVSASVSSPITVQSAQNIKMSITNALGDVIYVPAFKVYGIPLLGGPSHQVTREIAGMADMGKRLELRGNPYLQSKEQATGVAEFLAWWFKKPRLMLELRNQRGFSARKLGQRIRVMDSADDLSANIDFTGIVTRLEFSLSINADTRAIRYNQGIQLIEDSFMNANERWFILGQDNWGNSSTILWY